MNKKSFRYSASRRTLAIATTLAIAVTGLASIPAKASVPAEGLYSCATGQISDESGAPRYRIVGDGIVSQFGTDLCVGAVVLPEGVTVIGGAFQDATELTSINIPDSVTRFEPYSFAGTGLTSITIPDSVTMIEGNAFQGASSLTSIVIPDSITFIDSYTFDGATSLTSITIPSSVTAIGDRAFARIGLRASFYFLGNAPTLGGENVFYNDVPTTGIAFIQPSATGFGDLNSDVEVFWDDLIVRPTPSYVSSDLYENWQTPLSSSTKGPKIGDVVYATAFERELSRFLFNPDSETAYRTDVANYPLEEYVYRITKEENVATSSLDRQSNSGYEMLSAAEQNAWYTSMGYGEDNPYWFLWTAFMCAEDSLDVSQNVVRSLTKPNRLTRSYASREDGVLDGGGFNRNHSYMFRDLTASLYNVTSPSTRTVVGINNYDYTEDALVGGGDLYFLGSHSFGVMEVNSNCGPGKTLQALRIVDSETQIPLISKSFTVTREITVEVLPMDFREISASGVTIGVTGIWGVYFDSALWGLTTIAGSRSQTSDGAAEVNTAAKSRTKSAVFTAFGGNSSKVPASVRKGIAKFSSGFKEVSSVACTGYTSGVTPSRFASSLAKKRAKAVCDLVKQKFPDAKVKLAQKPAKGLGAQFRSVRIRVTGN